MSTIPVTLLNGSPGALAASYTTASITPAANTRAVVFGAAYRNGLLVKPVISDSLGTLTWTEIGNVHSSNITNPDLWIVAWISSALGATPAAMTVTITSTGAAGVTCGIPTVLAVDTDGTVIQTATGEDLVAGDPSFTFGATPGASNIVLGCTWMSGGNAVTKPTGYTSMFDNTPTNLAARRVSVFYDNTSAAIGPNQSISTNIRSVVLAIELGIAAAPTGRVTKVWSGSAWITKPLKYWTGSTWTVKPIKTWSGSVWR